MVSLVAYLGMASGVALLLTGLALAAARPRRDGGWVFVAFLLAWGLETTLFNSLSFMPDLSTLLLVQRIALAVLVVEFLFLVHFTVRFTRSHDSAHRLWSWGALALAVGVGSLFALDPGLFAELNDDSVLSTVLISVPKFGAFFVTVGILAARHRETRSHIEHREVRIVLVALCLYAAYTAGFYLSLYGLIWVTETPTLTEQILANLFALGTAFLLAVAAWTWRTDPVPERWDPRDRPALVGAIVVPLVIGLVTGTAETVALPRVDLFGLLRIGAALLVTYGLLKFEIFDIDRKVKTGIRGSVIAGAFVLMFFGVSETVEVLISDAAGTWAGLGAAGVLTVALRPLEKQAHRIADRAMPDVDDSDEYEEKRSFEVYQAAVERAARDEVLTDREKEILSGLREDLDLRDSEARRIEEQMLAEPIAL